MLRGESDYRRKSDLQGNFGVVEGNLRRSKLERVSGHGLGPDSLLLRRRTALRFDHDPADLFSGQAPGLALPQFQRETP